MLSVPASRPDRIHKALASGADEVVVDLEDAVAPQHKSEARDVVRSLEVEPAGVSVAVRVNELRSAWGLRDLEAIIASTAPIRSIVVPKVESREDLTAVEQVLDGLAAEAGMATDLRIQALVETAAGIAALPDIVSRRHRLDSVIVGYADLAASLGRTADADPSTWLTVQMAVLTHARSAGVAAVDGPHLSVADDDGFRDAVGHSAALGFDAKWVIHPRQIAAVGEAFRPSREAIEHATRVVEALDAAHRRGAGAVSLDGDLIDEAMAVAARRTLAAGGLT